MLRGSLALNIELNSLTSQLGQRNRTNLLSRVSCLHMEQMTSHLFGVPQRGSLMVHETTVERVTNRVWGIFSSLDHGIAGNNNRRALLRAYIASLAERGEHNADKLTVDGLVYLQNLTSHKKSVKRRA